MASIPEMLEPMGRPSFWRKTSIPKEKYKYTLVALDHLSDANTYQKVSRMSAKTIENKVDSYKMFLLSFENMQAPLRSHGDDA